MTPLLESLSAGLDDHGPLAPLRREAFDAAVAAGLPGPRNERWKYTPLRAFERRRFEPAASAPGIDPALLEQVPAPRAVFVDGRFDAALSQLDSLPDGVRFTSLAQRLADDGDAAGALLPQGDDVFAALNRALAADGVVLEVAADLRLQAPLHLVFVARAGASAAWALASRVTLGAGAEACIVEHQIAAGEHSGFGNQRIELELADGARLTHVRLQTEADGGSLIARSAARVGAGACYHRVDLELGAALSRHELAVDLVGEGAELIANGVLLADARRHLDTRLAIRHVVGNTRSTMLWRGLGAARGRAVFHGGIVIEAGADGSAAELSNKNLLLSAEAEIDTQPVLEIHADEVRAAHGATVGQLDPTALFYLRSRGLPAMDAQRLLTVAFCREPLAGIDDSALATLVAAQLDARLHAGGAL